MISGRKIAALVYLPDTEKDYRGTRFDWSGMIDSLKYEGHDFFGPWFDRTDPDVHDFIYRAGEIVAGPCSAITGPAEEFSADGKALGTTKPKAAECLSKSALASYANPRSRIR